MNERDALLNAVVENPEDDTPRLVYADWLEEHDESDRAELIRCLCEVVRLSAEEADHSRPAIRARELIALHRSDWFAPLRGWALSEADWWASTAVWRWDEVANALQHDDGRVADSFAEELKRLFALCPLRGISIDLGTQRARAVGKVFAKRFAELALLRRLQRLALVDPDNEELQLVFSSPFLSQLTSLRINLGMDWNSAGPVLEPASIRQALTLPGLAELAIVGGIISDGTAGAAASQINERGIEALASDPAASRLSAVDLSCNQLTESSIETLVASPHLAGVKRLDLRRNHLSQTAQQALRSRFGNRVIY